MQMNKRLAIALAALVCIAALSSISSCGPGQVIACTIAGCFDMLNVSISGAVPDDYIMKVGTIGREIVTVRCVNGEDVETTRPHRTYCNPRGFYFQNFDPWLISVTIVVGEESSTRLYLPKYETVFPNGPDCLPKCRMGNLTIRLTD